MGRGALAVAASTPSGAGAAKVREDEPVVWVVLLLHVMVVPQAAWRTDCLPAPGLVLSSPACRVKLDADRARQEEEERREERRQQRYGRSSHAYHWR